MRWREAEIRTLALKIMGLGLLTEPPSSEEDLSKLISLIYEARELEWSLSRKMYWAMMGNALRYFESLERYPPENPQVARDLSVFRGQLQMLNAYSHKWSPERLYPYHDALRDFTYFGGPTQ